VDNNYLDLGMNKSGFVHCYLSKEMLGGSGCLTQPISP
jgi:hypothetical protein